MKYEINKLVKPFIPYTVTITIETPEEAKIFHAEVACKIADSSPFIGAVYDASVGTFARNQFGNIPVSKQHTE